MIKLIFVTKEILSSISRQRAIVLDERRNIGLAIGKIGNQTIVDPANIKLAQAVESLSERLAE